MKRVLAPSLFITYPPSPFLFKRSFSVLFTFPNIGQNKSRWRLLLTATLLLIKIKVSSPCYTFHSVETSTPTLFCYTIFPCLVWPFHYLSFCLSHPSLC